MVKCALCGQEFKKLTWKHLHYKHGITAEQYREMGHLLGNEKFCEICGTMFVPYANKQRFCSPTCKYEYMSQNFKGPNHHNWGKTFNHTEEAKRKIKRNNAKYWQGKKRPKVGKKIAAKLKGRPNLALKGRSFPGRQNSGQFPKGISPWNKGKTGVYTLEQRKRISEGTKRNALRGPDNPAWKGGKTRIISRFRDTLEYKQWRTSVFQRDDYVCQICNKRGGSLVAHHIFSYTYYPDLRFLVSNGVTICRSCHSSLHNDPDNPYRVKFIKEGLDRH